MLPLDSSNDSAQQSVELEKVTQSITVKGTAYALTITYKKNATGEGDSKIRSNVEKCLGEIAEFLNKDFKNNGSPLVGRSIDLTNDNKFIFALTREPDSEVVGSGSDVKSDRRSPSATQNALINLAMQHFKDIAAQNLRSRSTPTRKIGTLSKSAGRTVQAQLEARRSETEPSPSPVVPRSSSRRQGDHSPSRRIDLTALNSELKERQASILSASPPQERAVPPSPPLPKPAADSFQEESSSTDAESSENSKRYEGSGGGGGFGGSGGGADTDFTAESPASHARPNAQRPYSEGASSAPTSPAGSPRTETRDRSLTNSDTVPVDQVSASQPARTRRSRSASSASSQEKARKKEEKRVLKGSEEVVELYDRINDRTKTYSAKDLKHAISFIKSLDPSIERISHGKKSYLITTIVVGLSTAINALQLEPEKQMEIFSELKELEKQIEAAIHKKRDFVQACLDAYPPIPPETFTFTTESFGTRGAFATFHDLHPIVQELRMTEISFIDKMKTFIRSGFVEELEQAQVISPEVKELLLGDLQKLVTAGESFLKKLAFFEQFEDEGFKEIHRFMKGIADMISKGIEPSKEDKETFDEKMPLFVEHAQALMEGCTNAMTSPEFNTYLGSIANVAVSNSGFQEIFAIAELNPQTADIMRHITAIMAAERPPIIFDTPGSVYIQPVQRPPRHVLLMGEISKRLGRISNLDPSIQKHVEAVISSIKARTKIINMATPKDSLFPTESRTPPASPKGSPRSPA